MPSVLDGAAEGHAFDALTNATLTISGSLVIPVDFGDDKELNVVVTVQGPVAGGGATLQFSISDLDQNGASFNADVGPSINAAGGPVAFNHELRSSRQLLSWVVAGVGSSFGGVSVSIKGTIAASAAGGGVASVDVTDRSSRLLGHVSVDNFPATQSVSGTVTASQGVAAALSGAWPVEITDGAGTVIGSGAHPVRTDPTGATTQPVSGTVTGNQGAPNSVANSWPVEITDGTNVLGVAAHPVRTDPTGATTQPVSGTVTANQGAPGASAWPVSAASLPLPNGAATDATLQLVDGLLLGSQRSFSTDVVLLQEIADTLRRIEIHLAAISGESINATSARLKRRA